MNLKNRDKKEVEKKREKKLYECVDMIESMEIGYVSMAEINLDMAEMGLPVDYRVLCKYEDKVLGDD